MTFFTVLIITTMIKIAIKDSINLLIETIKTCNENLLMGATTNEYFVT